MRPSSEIEPITALRGIAALYVVVFHFKKNFAYDIADVPLFGAVFNSGYMAVDLFFILSGLIMTHVYGPSLLERRFSYGNFIRKRLARLYPMHLVSLLAVVLLFIIGSMVGTHDGLEGPDARYFWQNLLMVHGFGTTGDLTFNYPSWSISAEMGAYLLFPLFFTLLMPFGRKAVIPAALFALTCFLIASPFFHLSEQMTWGILRIMPEFALGVGMGMWLINPNRYAWSMTLGGASLFIVSRVAGLGEIPSIIGLAILVGGCFTARASVHPVLLYLGRISFSIYMTHALVGMVGFAVLEKLFSFPGDSAAAWGWVPMLGATLITASLAHHLIEEPGQKFVMSLRRPRAVPA